MNVRRCSELQYVGKAYYGPDGEVHARIVVPATKRDRVKSGDPLRPDNL